MAGRSASILVKILGDESGLKKSLGGAGSDLDSFSKRMDAQGKKFQDVGTKMTAGITLPLAAIGALSVKNFMQAEKASAQLEASFKSTGAAAWTSVDQIDTLAQSMQKKYAVDGDLVKSGASLLLTFRNVKNAAGEGNAIFDRVTKTAIDMSRKLGMDLPQANMLLGKALNDPIKGMGTLRKAGVQLTESQQEQVRSFMAVGDVMSAQKVILGELETQFAGSAEAFANTAEGKLERAKLAFEDVSEEIGGKLLPIITGLAEKLSGALSWFDGLSSGTQNFIIALGGIAAAVGPVTTVIGTLMRAGETLSALKDRLAQVTTNADGTRKSLADLGRAGQALTFAAGIVGVIALANALNSLGQDANETRDRLNQLKLIPTGNFDQALTALDAYGDSLTSAYDKTIGAFSNKIVMGSDGAVGGLVTIKTGLENLAKAGEWDQLNTALDALRKAAALPANAAIKPQLEELIAQYGGVADRQAQVDASAAGAADGIAGVGDAAEGTGAQLEAAAPGFDTLMASVGGVKALADQLKTSLDALFAPTMDLEAANSAYQAGLDQLSESIAKNGTTLDINTEQGRANRDVLVGNTKASLDLMNAEIASGMSAEEAAGRHKMRTENLIAEAVQSGMTEGQVRTLIGAYGDVPSDVITKAQFDSIQAMLDAGNLTGAARIYGALTPEARARFEKNAATADIDALKGAIAGIPRSVTTTITTVQRIIAQGGSGTPYSIGIIEQARNQDLNCNGVIGRAGGGPVRKGHPYLVGEREPELFVPNVNGVILNQRQMRTATAATLQQAPAPVVVNVHFNGPVARDAERWVVQQVEAAVAKGVQLPKLKRAMA